MKFTEHQGYPVSYSTRVQLIHVLKLFDIVLSIIKKKISFASKGKLDLKTNKQKPTNYTTAKVQIS